MAGYSRSTDLASGIPPSRQYNANAELHFVGGDPQSAGFCDRPGPGMALEQNPFLPPTTTGRGTWMTVIRRDHGELNITTNCITRSGQDVTSKNYPTKPHKADSKNSLRCEELYNYALCYVPDSWQRRWFEAPMQPGRSPSPGGPRGTTWRSQPRNSAAVAGTKPSLC